MEISTGSWHYRLISDSRVPPRNLCPYMRSLVWCMFKLGLKWTGLAAVAIFLLLSVVAAVTSAIDAWFIPGFAPSWYDWRNTKDNAWIVMVVFGGIELALAVIIPTYFAYDKFVSDNVSTAYWNWKERRRLAKQAWLKAHYEALANGTKKPNVFVEWFRAFNEKTCPQLDFKYDNA